MKQRLDDNAVANAAGRAVVRFGPVPYGLEWLVERIVVLGAATELRAYAGYESTERTVEQTSSPNPNVADEASPVWLIGGDELILVWTGAAAGDVMTAIVQVDERVAELPAGSGKKRRAVAARGGW